MNDMYHTLTGQIGLICIFCGMFLIVEAILVYGDGKKRNSRD